MSLEEIIVTRLERIPTNGGDVLHAIKKTDLGFVGFGEAYFSWIQPGSIKPWKMHKEMTLNLVVPIGSICFVFLKVQDNEPRIRVEKVGVDRYVRLTVPPRTWFAFKGLSSTPSLLMNIANIVHDPAEIERCELDRYHLDWDLL